ncbi:hybrid sensor histidine kinase/response regulator [Ideonella sp.]|uniref:hybrid sensor histidine kinase/response regulator n=1 Tax=Ideonella sp. TaxID=1929293 RepID=UPI002E368DA1|nr:ATP-binding protein [Ideonella sp.]
MKDDACPPPHGKDCASLLAEISALRMRLEEAEETLRAIRGGEVDALVVGDRLYVLEGVEAASNRFRSEVIAQIDDAVIAVDNEQRVTYMNEAAARQYGVAVSHALGRPLPALYDYRWLDPADAQAAATALARTGSWRGRNVHVKHSGEQIHVESTVTVTRDNAGEPTGLLAVVRDVSERVKVEAALEDADRRKDEFLATLAHELRNPLAPIRNALQMMQIAPDTDIHAEAHGIIERQLKQMVHLVDDLLDVSRISQGKVELRREHVDLVSAIQAAIETSKPLIAAGRHELTVRLPAPRTLIVDGDLTRLTQIIANLMNNAAKYTPEGGHITLSAERDGEQVAIQVCDSGIGIPRDMLPRVFDLFAQVDRSLERAQGGLGIGLALVRKLAEMHGGSVDVDSDGANRGCTFTVRLPLLHAPADRDADAAGPLPRGVANDIRVLVVDDNIDSAQSMSLLLSMLGYSTRTAHDGLEAVRAAGAYQPQAVILDIGLPKLSGLDAARRIREQAWGQEMLLIALSGWGQDEDRQRTRQAGFDHHFVKPVAVDALIQVLAEVQAVHSPCE